MLRLGEESGDAGDVLMHRLDQVDNPRDAGESQPVEAAKIVNSR